MHKGSLDYLAAHLCLFGRHLAETNRAPFAVWSKRSSWWLSYRIQRIQIWYVLHCWYAHIVIGSAVFVLLFLGGWHIFPGVADPWPAGYIGAVLSTATFLGKTCCLIFFFIWIRWTLPRFRYDQVMHLGWVILLPIAIANLILNIAIIAVWDKFNG